MKKIHGIGFFLLVVLASGCTSTPAPKPFPFGQESPYRNLDTVELETIIHVPTGQEVSQEQMLDYLESSRIIYIGEVHTNIYNHRVQMDVIKGLQERFSGKIAIGMEMFDRSAQSQLDLWTAGKLDEKSFTKTWYANWEQDMAYYRELLFFIRDQKIPLVGLNAPREQIHLLSMKGLEGLTEEERKQIPDFDADDPYHRQSMEAIFGGHVHGEGGFDPFYQTMLLWDETMAESIVNYLNSPEGEGRKIVVLAGGFHVTYGFGIPRRVFRRLPEPYTIVLPYTSVVPEGKEYVLMEGVTPFEVPLPIADFAWSVPYDDLEEERVRLGVHIEPSDKGVLVKAVEPGSPAEKAGISSGDIITDFDNEPVLEPFDLIYLIKQKRSGDELQAKILRGEERFIVEVVF